MAASNTDLFRKSKSLFSTTLNGAITDSATTIALNSASGLPTDTAVTLTIDRSGTREVVTGVISGNNITNAVRGQGGTSAAAHNSGDNVEAIFEQEQLNDMVDGMIAEHSQAAGLHAGKRSFFVPSISMWPSTTNGCAALAKTELGTNDVDIQTLDFDQSSDEFAQFTVRMPNKWDAGTITFSPQWTAASGSGGVVFFLQGISYADSDAMDAAWGTAVSSSDTLLTANDLHEGPTSAAITIAGTPAAGETVQFRIYRDVSDAGDTLTADAKLMGVYIIYTATALNQA